MKILCTGDAHIGRRPSRLPLHVDCRPLSCGNAWTRIVDLAITEKVELVAVSGDLVDRKNRFYEAAGPVQEGLRRLAHAGIVTVMVAGNHDHDVLPWLVEGLGPEHVRLLGKQGRWERFTLERNGEALHVDGWSFPEEKVHENPLATYPFSPDGTPTLGLLHADLDQAGSRYAPVPLAELRARPAALWLLGHIHAPRLLEESGSPAVLYPGSPQAMDPGEAGEHGVWMADVSSSGLSCRMVPLSSVRYDTVEVRVDGIADPLALDRAVADAVDAHLRKVVQGSSALRYVSCRLRIVGRSPLHREIESRLAVLVEDLELTCGAARGLVESFTVATAPQHDLAAVACGSGAPAVLARLVDSIDDGGPDGKHEPLLRTARRTVDDVWRSRQYLSLVRDTPPDEEIEARLRERAVLLLDGLLAQKEVEA